MAFFEAYGAVCGDAGVPQLDGFSTARDSSAGAKIRELRACAAMALGRIGSPKALEALRKAAGEKDVVVRNAVTRALRGGGPEPRGDSADARATGDAGERRRATRSATRSVRRAGRQLIFALYGALRAVKLYPVENAAVQKALADVTAPGQRADRVGEGELELRMSGEFIFVNETRLRLDLDNFASFSHLLSLFRGAGIGTRHAGDRTSTRRTGSSSCRCCRRRAPTTRPSGSTSSSKSWRAPASRRSR